MHKQYEWQFFRAGEVDQVVIRTGQDIAHIGELDQKLWVALACPTRGIEFDGATLDLIDESKDGRIRPPELVAACEWAVARVRDPQVLADGGDVLQLGSINDATPEGALLLAEARRVLELAGLPDAAAITLTQVQERMASLQALRFNGDGIVGAATAEGDEALAALIARIQELYGAVDGSDGVPGIDRSKAEAFWEDLQALQTWFAQADELGCHLQPRALALAAAEAVNAVQAKVDDFFARTRLVEFDANARAPLNPTEEGYAALGAQVLSNASESLAALPLAAVTGERSLPLVHGVNPAWAAALQTLREQAVQPVFGEALSALTEAQWDQLKTMLAHCQQWLAECPATPLGAIGEAEVQQLLASGLKDALMQLLDQDDAEKEHAVQAMALEKLIRLQRDLLPLLNNFVSFSSFYRREGAAFQAGTLFLDGRSCDLTVEVADAAAHSVLAAMAKTYLAYCECKREGQKKIIVAAFTAGDVDFLFVGRNGVFYDRAGQDWDATIVKLIDNPTSIGQAFFSPYKKFLRMIEEQVAKHAAAKNDVVNTSLGDNATKLVTAPKELTAASAAAAPAAAATRKTDVGTVAAIGVALGSLSAVIVGIFGKFIELGPWIPVAILGLILAISGPSMLIAWLKLRQRSLGPILDASGWAINGRMNINLGLGRSLSQTARVPVNAKRNFADPYADSHGLRNSLCLLALLTVTVLLAWRMHWLDAVLPASWQHVPAATSAPAVTAPAAAAAESAVR
ncbi:hypothetical protein O987_22885 [Comamonas testosteroni TK102]|jgi:hypothetical protein|uniref:EF-hand domain-containing protein n=1 Tax=Comamonas testosteroni TK102 TaxID=1392005 RepID=A0A076PXW7_COMTE|nr:MULTISPECIES: hypothetical protein [Comamonas]AIJ48665.1 hypothetical protein O987_22885 [Comamonas testosteroni TK102]MPS90618.1 hypothetical protein [Comamonas sp.]TYK69202.1 hypothetical protein FSY59_17745 [Comamonas sp. Z3]